MPAGKTFDDLTQEEEHELRQKYRFDPLYPGLYQSITGFGMTHGELTRKYNQYVIPLMVESDNDELDLLSSLSSVSD